MFPGSLKTGPSPPQHLRHLVRTGSDQRVWSCTKPVDMLTRTYLNLEGDGSRMTSIHPVNPGHREVGGIRMAGVGDRVGTSRRWKSRRPQGGAGLCIGTWPQVTALDLLPSSDATSSRKPAASEPSSRFSLWEPPLFLYAVCIAYFLSIDPFVPNFCLPLFPV